jgi:pimeloyl-ACP methyl ester carboxylesterase
MSLLDRHPWSRKMKHWLSAHDFPHKTITWNRANGIASLICMGQVEDQNRSTVLFLHGLGNDALFPNVQFFKYLLKKGYNIVAADLDGHGQTPSSTELSQLNFRTLVSDMVHQFDQLTIGKPQLHFCGFSFGAVHMLDYCVHNPERVKSLSLIGMPLFLHSKLVFVPELLTPCSINYWRSFKDYGFIRAHPAIGPFGRTCYPIRLESMKTSQYLELTSYLIDDVNPLNLLRIITFPTLYTAGTLDFIANLKSLEPHLQKLGIQTFAIRGETHFSSMLSIKTAKRIEVLLRNSH